MPLSPSIGTPGLPSWKDARRKQLVTSLEGMDLELDMAERAASAVGDNGLNACLDWVREQGATPRSLGSGLGSWIGSEIGLGTGLVGLSPGGTASSGRVRVWNESTCSYEWIRGIDAETDEEEMLIETLKSPLRRTKTLSSRALLSGSGGVLRTSLNF